MEAYGGFIFVCNVECPDCGATRSLEPHRGVIRFKSHDKRKTRTPPTNQRWVKGETAWEVTEVRV